MIIIFCNWIFKLPESGKRDGLTIYPFIFIRKIIMRNIVNLPLYRAQLVTHEKTHAWQNIACIIIGLWVLSVLYLMGVIDSKLWVLAPYGLFYVIYGLMFLYEFARYHFSAKKFESEYRATWFERMARKRAGV